MDFFEWVQRKNLLIRVKRVTLPLLRLFLNYNRFFGLPLLFLETLESFGAVDLDLIHPLFVIFSFRGNLFLLISHFEVVFELYIKLLLLISFVYEIEPSEDQMLLIQPLNKFQCLNKLIFILNEFLIKRWLYRLCGVMIRQHFLDRRSNIADDKLLLLFNYDLSLFLKRQQLKYVLDAIIHWILIQWFALVVIQFSELCVNFIGVLHVAGY